jgi:AraC-like DNA-binding protein/uncharacterized membrane protein YfcA
MYDQIRNDTLFGMLYAVVSALFLAACCYLLFRQGNAFARDVTPPVRLRWWTAAYFAATAVCHLWYMQIFFLTSAEDIMITDLIGGLLDSVLAVPLVICVMLNMLQDRRRPLWPIPLMIAPFVVGEVYSIATLSYAVIPMLHVYLLLLSICIAIYMFRATRQYGRWLRDNYADLEHKEVWQSFLVLAVILLIFGFYVSGVDGLLYEYIIQVCGIVLICYLLWRVETLSDLSIHAESIPVSEPIEPVEEETDAPDDINDITPLLQHYCINTKLYLQHDLNVTQLAQAIGSNRTYLGQYFASQDTTYNEYINNLRINHFISLYREAVASLRPFSAKQLANDSGYHSYSTFSLAFKQRMGQSVTAWMRDQNS